MKKPQNLFILAYIGSASSAKSLGVAHAEAAFRKAFENDENILWFFGREAATILLESNPDTDNTAISFQFLVINFQLLEYEKAVDLAYRNPDKLVVYVTDRSMLDGIVYVPVEWQKCIGFDQFVPIYDAFLFFDFDAKYIKDAKANNEFRKEETKEAFIELANKTAALYLNSGLIPKDKVSVVPCRDSLDDKLEFASRLAIKLVKERKEAFCN